MSLSDIRFSPGQYLAPVVDWLNANLHPLFAAISRVIEFILGGCEAALLALPAWLIMLAVAGLAYFFINLRAALLALVMLGFCLICGLWTASMQTIALVTVSVLISVSVAFPLGILAARYKRMDAAVGPLLNVMQTVPPCPG